MEENAPVKPVEPIEPTPATPVDRSSEIPEPISIQPQLPPIPITPDPINVTLTPKPVVPSKLGQKEIFVSLAKQVGEIFAKVPHKKTVGIVAGILMLLIVAAAAVPVIIAKINEANYKPPVVEKVIIKPKQVVQDFYNWYLKFKGSPMASGIYKTQANLSSVFVNYLNNKATSAAGLNYDPFICGQVKPMGVGVEESSESSQTAQVMVNIDFEKNIQVPVSLVLEGEEWKISHIACPQIEEEKKAEEEKVTTTVFLFFNNAKKDGNQMECSAVHEVERTIPNPVDPLLTALNLLFAGPSAAETIEGFVSPFNEGTKDLLRGVKIIDKTAYVDLRDRRSALPNANTACSGAMFVEQISATVKKYRPKVTKVVIGIEGDPKKFYDWMQMGCVDSNGFCDSKGF